MCNLYSQSTPRQHLLNLFRVGDNRADAFEPQDAIFPGHDACIVKKAPDGERECVRMNWGFVLQLKNQAPKRVTNFRDDKLSSPFWSTSFRERRCLVPVTSFAEPKGRRPATWYWFALSVAREPFAFAGIWQTYTGVLKQGAETVQIDVYSFMTTTPNSLVASVHPLRMPLMLVGFEAQEQWLDGTPNETKQLVCSYPAEDMTIVQSSPERRDMGKPS